MSEWRTLSRVATAVAIFTIPSLVIWFHRVNGLSWLLAFVAAIACAVAFRGLLDLVFHKSIPRPALFGLEDKQLQEEDVIQKKRAWFWEFWLKMGIFLAIIYWLGLNPIDILSNPALLMQGVFVFFLFLANFAILFGPLLAMNMSQIQSFEPGDAEWGVKLSDVRGQKEAKEEVRKVVTIWQSGEAFEAAGGKRERGLLMLGPPGVGKTMLAKAIATGFNCPFVSMPGSGFAATFIGIDAVIVRLLARKAKKLARKWGGQCIVFIDEIDAVGMRRQSLGLGMNLRDQILRLSPDCRSYVTPNIEDDKEPRRFMIPGMGGGSLALNQLLVVMDGIDNPPFFRKFFTSKLNTLLDATYIVPRRKWTRLPAAKPRKEQIYFIGATNVPLESLDPALIRPGRMGRHIWFRNPTKQDRLDIIDLYLTKAHHDLDMALDTRRDEFARVTNGYSPAMIEQVISMALTFAHHDGRGELGWADLTEAMTTLESGTAVGIDYTEAETWAVAIHEAGHAVCGHLMMEGSESTRLSIRMRGGSLGHHQALQKEERFSRFQSEEFGRLVWGLGAMAAEHVFFGENSNGVGGDVQQSTALAAYMVGASGMALEEEDLTPDTESRGLRIMNRVTGGGPLQSDPIAGVLGDPEKKKLAAQLLGQAYFDALFIVKKNREAVERIAQALVERKEIFGNELLNLLEGELRV